ncbi:MAG: hypothetical protein IT381_10285 [Deltaproteobacteria bacterium]|nr:hypothetical protein [Deltaproteobacteria bacterium]
MSFSSKEDFATSARAILCWALLLLPSCFFWSEARSTTTIDLTITFDTSFAINGVRASGSTADRALGPTTSPDSPDAPLQSPYRLVILLTSETANALNGAEVAVRVEGLANNNVVELVGKTSVIVREGTVTTASVTLDVPPLPVCGDGEILAGVEACDDGGVIGGDGCGANCALEPGFACEGLPSTCSFVCGNGVVNENEGCDDGGNQNGDGCSGICSVESGYKCIGEPSSCFRICGNGQVDSGETCDDGGASSPGCSASCQTETLYECPTPGMPCRLICGNGALNPGETCDDGGAASPGCDANCQTEALYACLTPGAPCTPLCGNGALDGTEICDPGGGGIFSLIGGTTARHNCLSEGLLQGAGSQVTCSPSCTLVTTSCTGGSIDSAAKIVSAIAEAFDNVKNPGHDVISIRQCASGCTVGGAYQPSSAILINEPGTDEGMTLRPMSGIVQFSGTMLGGTEVLQLRSGKNNLAAFDFVDAPLAISFHSADTTGANTVLACSFAASAGSAQFVDVQSKGNTILANRFDAGGTNTYAINVAAGAANTTIVANVISGNFDFAIDVGLTSTGTTILDHNSLRIVGASKYGIHLNTGQGLCARNNAIIGDGSSRGYQIDSAPTIACANGPATGNNGVLNAGSECAGAGCGASTCLTGSPGPLCSIIVGYQASGPPTLDTNFCPGPPLRNAGADAGYFMDPTPDIGARQSGRINLYGSSVLLACP